MLFQESITRTKQEVIIMRFNILRIKELETPGKGCLAFFESQKDISFQIKRIYYIYDVQAEVERGGHAHRKLKQLLFCPYGHIDIRIDDGTNKQVINLNNPSKALLLDGPVWHEMIWKKENSVLVVAASDYYDEADYIRDYSSFKKYLELIGGDNE